MTDFEKWIRGRRGGSISILYPFLENTCMLLPGRLPFFVFFFSPTCVSVILLWKPISHLAFFLSFSRHHIRMVFRLQALHFLLFLFFFLSFFSTSSYYLLLMLSSSLDKTSVHLYSFFHSMSCILHMHVLSDWGCLLGVAGFMSWN